MNFYKEFIIIFVIIGTSMSVPQCGLYGSPPCSYLPALPGHTPLCAAPGKTYCEHVPHYPVHVIKHLIQKWTHDVKNFIADETGENFNSIGYRNPVTISQFYGPSTQTNQLNSYTQNDGYKYGPTNGFNTNNNGNGYSGIYNEDFPEPIYIPRPGNNNNNNGYNNNPYNTQQQQYSKGGYYYPTQSHFNSAENFKRYVRELSSRKTPVIIRKTRKTRSVPNELLENTETFAQKVFLDKITNEGSIKSRQKRQSPGRNILCEIRNSFIQPQAALNSKGNWMYVVNQVETARQLVKTETCASSLCSNLCSLPNNYNSRCEQKYVQKRLVALEGTGQRLYTDTFWFPSCCVCTISNF